MTQSTEQERVEFEAWALQYGTWDVVRDDNPTLETTGYTDLTLTVAWHAVQAARRAPVVPQGWQDLAKRCLVAMETAVHFRKTGEGRPPEQTCLFEIEELRAALAAALQPPEAARRAPVGAVPQALCVICGSDAPYTGTCGSNDPRALCKKPAPQPPEAAPVQLPEPDGLFSFGANDDRPSYHHGQTDKQWLNELFDKSVTGGPYRSEFAYSESKVLQLLTAHGVQVKTAAPLVQIEATPELTALLETSAKTGMTLVTKDEHPWAAYLNARKVAIHHYHAEGRSFDDIAAVLNLADSAHVERIYNATSAKVEPHDQSSKG